MSRAAGIVPLSKRKGSHCAEAFLLIPMESSELLRFMITVLAGVLKSSYGNSRLLSTLESIKDKFARQVGSQGKRHLHQD